MSRTQTLARNKIWLRGVREFRLGITTHYDWPEIEIYDKGREFAHKMTLRKFEQ
jgi:hypothetical protein